MLLVDDIRNDIAEARGLRLPRRYLLLVMLGSLPIYWLFNYFGRLNMALPVLNCVAVFGFLIALKWKLRRCCWFWGVMIFIAALHVPLIMFIPWTNNWVPALAIGLIDSADFCVIVGILAAVERLLRKIDER